MFFTFFALTIAYLQPISSQELQIIPKADFNLQILPRVSSNLGCGCQNNLITPNNYVCSCQLCQGQIKLIPTNPCGCRKCKNVVTTNNIKCGCQKQLDVLPRNNLGCSCQRQSNVLPLNYGRCTCNNNMGCRCQGPNNILPANRCGCQSQNTLILPNTCGCKRQPNFLVPISNIWYESQKPNSLVPVNDIGCKCRLQNTIPKNDIACGCQNQQNITPTKLCGCKRVQIPRSNSCGCQNIRCKCNRQINVIPPSIDGCDCKRPVNIVPMQKTLVAYQIPSLPSENELTISNTFSVTDLPLTTLPSVLSEGLSRRKDFQRRNDLFELKSRLTEMTDLVSATAKLLSLLPKINGDNSFPFNKHGNGSITDLPVAGNDD